MPVIGELVNLSVIESADWINNLEGILAAIFGTYVPAVEGTEAVIDPADEVVFTLVSFEYCGDPIYSKAA